MDSGALPLYRFDPRRGAVGENPLKLDSKAPSIPFADFALKETRFRMLQKSHPERAKHLLAEAEKSARARFDLYRQMAEITYGSEPDKPAGETN